MASRAIYHVRQGDVLLIRCNAIPNNAQLVLAADGRPILAHGEVTGHAHRINDGTKARLFDANTERFLQISEKVALSHDEHTAIVLNKGIYRQAFQVEDFGEEVRRVTD